MKYFAWYQSRNKSNDIFYVLLCIALLVACRQAQAQTLAPPLARSPVQTIGQPMMVQRVSPSPSLQLGVPIQPFVPPAQPGVPLLSPSDLRPVAEDVNLVTLEWLQQLAMENNPTLRQAARDVQALQGRWVQEGLRPNPNAGYVAEEVGEGGRAGKQGFEIGQTFLRGNKLELNRAVVSHEIQQARARLDAQRLRVQNDVRIAAYSIAIADQRVGLWKQLVQISEEGYRMADAMFRVEEVGKIDPLEANISLHKTRMELRAAENDRRTAWRELTCVLGLPEMADRPIDIDLEQDIPDISWDFAWQRLTESSPKLQSAWYAVERAKCNLARQNAGRIADVDIGGGMVYDSAENVLLGSAGFSIPLMIHDQNQGNISAARSELAGSQRNVERVQLALQRDLTGVMGDYIDSRHRVNVFRSELLAEYQENLDLTMAGYKQGEFNYQDILLVQEMYSQGHLEYLDNLDTLWKSVVQIDGLLLTGSLDDPTDE